jgi:hypothetical protein
MEPAPPDDRRPRWEQVAEDRRRNGGLGLPAGWSPPRWVFIALTAVLLVNGLRNALASDSSVAKVSYGVLAALVAISLGVSILRGRSGHDS